MTDALPFFHNNMTAQQLQCVPSPNMGSISSSLLSGGNNSLGMTGPTGGNLLSSSLSMSAAPVAQEMNHCKISSGASDLFDTTTNSSPTNSQMNFADLKTLQQLHLQLQQQQRLLNQQNSFNAVTNTTSNQLVGLGGGMATAAQHHRTINCNNGGINGLSFSRNGGDIGDMIPSLPTPNTLIHRDGSHRKRGGVIEPFPERLHRLLLEVEAAGRSDVISFVSGGRAFAIHKPEIFCNEIIPYYFRQSRLSSFKRQLNLYGFELIHTGQSRGAYCHDLFARDRPELCRKMRRVMASNSSSSREQKKKVTIAAVETTPTSQKAPSEGSFNRSNTTIPFN